MALFPEVDAAIEDIVNEAVVMDGFKVAVELELSEAKHLSDKIKEKIYLEFQGILDMLNFQTDAHDIFRKWYVDGKIYYHMIVDEGNQKQGIQELRYIDPRKYERLERLFVNQMPMGLIWSKRLWNFMSMMRVEFQMLVKVCLVSKLQPIQLRCQILVYMTTQTVQ